MLARAYSVKFGIIFRRPVWKTKVDKKQTYMKTETCKLYSKDFWIFLPKIIKINLYNSELYTVSKLVHFFETQCISQLTENITTLAAIQKVLFLLIWFYNCKK